MLTHPPKNKLLGRAALPGPLAFPFPPSRLLAPAELCARCLGPLVSHLEPSVGARPHIARRGLSRNSFCSVPKRPSQIWAPSTPDHLEGRPSDGLTVSLPIKPPKMIARSRSGSPRLLHRDGQPRSRFP